MKLKEYIKLQQEALKENGLGVAELQVSLDDEGNIVSNPSGNSITIRI